MGDIGHQLIEVGLQSSDSQAKAVQLAADFADSHEWALEGYSSAGWWIADMLDIARRTANEWIRVGRILRDLPATRQALEGQEISFTKAKELTRAATADNELELLELAQRYPASELGKAIAAWLSENEEDVVIDRRHEEARSLSWRTEADGMVFVPLRLTPAQAGVFIATVDAMVMRRAHDSRDDQDRWPSLAQQRADALIEVLTEGGAKTQTEVVIHVRGDGASLDDGTPITMTAVAEMIDESFIRALIHDAKGRPINASSKQRHPTARQKRVVKERDRACIDCGSTDLLEYDHFPDFAESHRTIVEELHLRCSTCHHFRHKQAG